MYLEQGGVADFELKKNKVPKNIEKWIFQKNNQQQDGC